MKIDLVFLTCNRLEYTQMALASILKDPAEEFRLYLWDNNSTDGTVEYLRSEITDPRIVEKLFHHRNWGQLLPLNEIWSQTSADLVGKLDNDCRVRPGWTRRLAAVHADMPELGALACWHFRPQDFDAELAAQKIQRFGRHQVFRHPWVGGTGFLMKRQIMHETGPLDVGSGGSMTGYFVKVARAGYINGWLYPFVLQEHLDDPLSSCSRLKTDRDLESLGAESQSLRLHGIHSMRQWVRHRNEILRELHTGPWNVSGYSGFRGRFRRQKRRIMQLFAALKDVLNQVVRGWPINRESIENRAEIAQRGLLSSSHREQHSRL